MIPQALATAAVDPELQHSALSVYVVLHGELDYQDYRPIKLAWLSRRTRLHHSYLSRIIQTLTRLGYLARGAKTGLGAAAGYTYRITLSPDARDLLEETASGRTLPPRPVVPRSRPIPEVTGQTATSPVEGEAP